ncbi:MAG: archease [Planctomycetota bacterium]|jgi:tRNA nucleotidyltransferase (CCA-adding enzyme)
MGNEIKTSGWEHFPHQADIGIRGVGATKEEAFCQAAMALTAVITKLELVRPIEEVRVSCHAEDDELLFVDWLNSLLYEMDTRKMLFSRFEVHIKKNSLSASAWGEKTNAFKHRPAVEVKAATYALLSVRKDKKGNWIAQCIVDV